MDPDATPRCDGMPMVGLGTYDNADHDQCVESVRTALELGYRHVDTAQLYRNEAAVGDGIAEADVDREDVFLATKVWVDRLGYDDVHSSVERSLEKLGTDYVDLLYVHWPADAYDPGETLSAFEELKRAGTIDRIGVSNFEPEQLDVAMDVCEEPIFANQIELHPLLQQAELREYCADVGVELVAYCPVARGKIADVDVLVDIADSHDATAYQVSLAWLRQKGVTAIPKAAGEDHIRENLQSLSLTLTDEELSRIDSIDRDERLVRPRFAPETW